MAFPEVVKDEIGAALSVAQFGGKHPAAKPWKGAGSGVLEVVEDHDGNTYRAVYTVRFRRAVRAALFSEKVAEGYSNTEGRCGAHLTTPATRWRRL